MDTRSLRLECLRLAASFCYRGPAEPVAVSHVLKVAADFEEYAGAVPAALGRDAKGRFAKPGDEQAAGQLAGNYANTIEGHAQLERDLAARKAQYEASQKAASNAAEQAANYALAELSGGEQHLPSIEGQPKSFLDRLYGKLGGSDD